MAHLHLTLAAPSPKAITLRPGPILVIAMAAILVIAMLQVMQTSRATTANFSIQQLEAEKVQLEAALSELEADVAQYSSLARIEEEAARLGLVPAAGRASLEVNVPLPVSEQRLPSRFAPDEEAGVDGQGPSWWQDLLKVIPFY